MNAVETDSQIRRQTEVAHGEPPERGGDREVQTGGYRTVSGT